MSSRATRMKHGAYIIHAQWEHCPCHARCYCMCSDIMRASRGMCMQASQPPLLYAARQELLTDVTFMQAEQYLSKITVSHLSTLNTKFANQNVLKRIPIAMLNENKANWNENFRICAEEPIPPLYKRRHH